MQNIIFQYLEWEFIDATKGILKAWKNFLKFNLEYWSIITLMKTFFSHWRRYESSYGRGFDLGRYFEVLTFNLVSRILGAILRSALIMLGLAVEIFIFLAGLIVMALWLTLPVLLILGIFYGFRMLF